MLMVQWCLRMFVSKFFQLFCMKFSIIKFGRSPPNITAAYLYPKKGHSGDSVFLKKFYPIQHPPLHTTAHTELLNCKDRQSTMGFLNNSDHSGLA